MHRFFAPATVAATALTVAAGLGAAAPATASWSAPVPSPGPAFALPNGDILFDAQPYLGSGAPVRTVLKRRGAATLDPPVSISDGPGGIQAVAPNGEALIAVGDGKVRIRALDGRLGPASVASGEPVAAANGAMALLSCPAGDPQLFIRAAGAAVFSRPIPLPGSQCALTSNRAADVAIDGRGTVTFATWDASGVQVRTATVDGRVSAIQSLSSEAAGFGTRLASQITVAANDAGDAVVAWNASAGVAIARRASSAPAFGPASVIPLPGFSVSINDRLAVDPEGGVAVPYGAGGLAGVATSSTIDGPLQRGEVSTVYALATAGGRTTFPVTSRGDVLWKLATSSVSPPPNPTLTFTDQASTSVLRRAGGPFAPVTTSMRDSTSELRLGPDGGLLWNEADGGTLRSAFVGPDASPARPATALTCAGRFGEAGLAAGQAIQTFTAGSSLFAASFAGGAIGVEPVPGLTGTDQILVTPTGDAAIVQYDATGTPTVSLRASGQGIGTAPATSCSGLRRLDVTGVPDQNGDILVRVRSGVRQSATAWLSVRGPGVNALRTVRLPGLGVTTVTVRMPAAIRTAYTTAQPRPNIGLSVLTSGGAVASGRVVG